MKATDWTAYRKCTTCLAETGQPCRTQSGLIVDARPDGIPFDMPIPHVYRRARVPRGKRAPEA